MNIPVCPFKNTTCNEPVFCPGCHSRHNRIHGGYTRKGFHVRGRTIAVPIIVMIPRYRCLNKECSRCTFSVLPPMVLRYCRFFWPCLLTVKKAITDRQTCHHLAKNVWQVGWGTIKRSTVELGRMAAWIVKIHREATDGSATRELGLMVKIIIQKIGHVELSNRWYCHRYPLRALPLSPPHHTI